MPLGNDTLGNDEIRCMSPFAIVGLVTCTFWDSFDVPFWAKLQFWDMLDVSFLQWWLGKIYPKNKLWQWGKAEIMET